MSSVQYIFGGGGLTEAWREDNIADLKKALQQAKINRIDSAAVYPYTAPGGADALLGDNKFPESFQVDTKALYFGDGSGTLSAEAIQKSLSGSLERLRVSKIPVFYCHAPDKQTPIADQAAAMDAEYRKGSFEKLGVSNFSAEMLSEWLQVAEEKGFVKPSVYQGQYNLLCRNHEKALFPLLRKHNISFVAYSPTAGGFLTGKLTFSKSPKDLVGTRFEESPTNFGGMMYRGYYDKPAMHEALKKASSACAKHNVALAEAALRWLLYHSTLSSDAGDGVIVGPSKMSQLDSCVAARDAGKLPGDLAQELDSLWDASVQEAAAPITVI